MEQRTEFQAQEILTIADDPTIEPNDKRIRVDTRKWIMARMKPKRYGDHLDVRHDVPEQVMAAVVYALAHPKPVDKSADKPVDKPK